MSSTDFERLILLCYIYKQLGWLMKCMHWLLTAWVVASIVEGVGSRSNEGGHIIISCSRLVPVEGSVHLQMVFIRLFGGK